MYNLNTATHDCDSMDSYTYYKTRKNELLREDDHPNQVSVTSMMGTYVKTVWGLDIKKQKDFFQTLCIKICYEYHRNGTSPFVRQMQEAARANHHLTPFEISVLREAYERYTKRSYEGLNTREFERSAYIPQIRKSNECYWHDKIIHEGWTYGQIAYPDIFDLEDEYRKTHPERVAAPKQTSSPEPAASAANDTELKEAQAKIKELQEQIQKLRQESTSERQSVIGPANEEAEKIRMAAVAEAAEIKARAEAEAKEIKANADMALADAEAKAQAVFKNKLAKKIVDQRAKTRDINIDGIKGEVKKYYAKPVDLARNNGFIEKSASDLQNVFSSVINDAIEKLKEEKTQMYEQMDQLRHDMYPSKEKLCIKWYLDYYGTWNKTGDTVIASLLASIEANKDKGTDLDPDGKIAANLTKLSGMLEKFMVEFENAIAALGFEVFRPETGDRYDSNEHRCSDQSDEEDTDDFNGRRIVACKKPGIKRIGLSGNEEVLEFAEVVVE